MIDLQLCITLRFSHGDRISARPTQDALTNLLVRVRVPGRPTARLNITIMTFSCIPIRIDEATCAVSRGHFKRTFSSRFAALQVETNEEENLDQEKGRVTNPSH